MTAQFLERTLALILSFAVGGGAIYQLNNERGARGLDAFVTKLLLGLMVLGCVLVLLGSLNILGGTP